MKTIILCAVLLMTFPAALPPLQAQIMTATTPEIFKQFSEHVVKIEVVETGSAAKASIGTGFYASSAGHIVTNYHVVSKMIHTPDRYRIEVTDGSAQAAPATVLGIDVVYDLAVLRTSRRPKGHLALESKAVAQGTRLYSLGHPRDLGLTIVEGTYNGLLRHTLYPKVHFTGSLNPGMSGGPTLTQAGRVVGVNVATEGEQISFLVPAERVLALIERTAKTDSPATNSFLADV
ncbi:MAG TPA: serine protease, partial [Candidatus Binatia bacterium]